MKTTKLNQEKTRIIPRIDPNQNPLDKLQFLKAVTIFFVITCSNLGLWTRLVCSCGNSPYTFREMPNEGTSLGPP